MLVLESSRVRLGGTLRFAVRNTGQHEVTLGLDYRVERLTRGGWVLCRRLTPQVVAMVVERLPPGGERWFELRVEGVEPGAYRVLKPVTLLGPGGPRRTVLEAVFTVEP